MPEASDEQVAAEVERRARGAASSKGLLIEQWDLDDIGADLDRCGLAGSPTKVFRVQSIVLTKEGYTEIPPTEDGVRQTDPRVGRRPDAGVRTEWPGRESMLTGGPRSVVAATRPLARLGPNSPLESQRT